MSLWTWVPFDEDCTIVTYLLRVSYQPMFIKFGDPETTVTKTHNRKFRGKWVYFLGLAVEHMTQQN